MSPSARYAAIAAGLVLLPAVAAAAIAPDQARALPRRIADRVREIGEDDDIETRVHRLGRRLSELTDDLESRVTRSGPPVGRIAAIVAALMIVPAALGALYGTRRGTELRGRMSDAWHGDQTWDDDNEAVQRELDGLSQRLSDLDADLQSQREDAFDAVTKAAKSDG